MAGHFSIFMDLLPFYSQLMPALTPLFLSSRRLRLLILQIAFQV